jgi:hypothetical protein
METGRTWGATGSLLIDALAAAVPLRIAELKERGGPSSQDYDWVRSVVPDLLGSEGDCLMFHSRERGQTAKVFNALARGLAVMAFCPGGVRWCGEHWEATA